MTKRRFEATQQTTIRDLQRIMTKINATSLRIDQDVMKGGVKVIFDRAGKRYVRECTKYDSSLDNLRVIGLQIEYLYRALEVYAEDIVETSFDIEFDRIFNGFLATPDDTALLLGDGKAPWFEVLGVQVDARREDIRNAFRALSLVHHPDRGGRDEDFKRINEAFREGMKTAK
ncbi:MAG TPA: J domain-containing protein [Anaerolineales bacterium]|nr:J domain-containing protein [Anaerolineales bacterium]